MSDSKLIRINADVADSATMRLFGFAAMARAINAAIESGDDDACNSAPEALRLLADDIHRFAVELDVCTWSDSRKQRRRVHSALQVAQGGAAQS